MPTPEEDEITLYHAARAAIDRGEDDAALSLLQKSLAQDVHFKTLELIGGILLRLGRPGEAVIPLAAATTLNLSMSRAPCLLAEAFLATRHWSDARTYAAEALRRTPGYRRAIDALTRAERALQDASIDPS